MRSPGTDKGWERVIQQCFGYFRLRVEWDAHKQQFVGLNPLKIMRFNPKKAENQGLWSRLPELFKRNEEADKALVLVVSQKQYGDAEDQLVLTRMSTFLALLEQVHTNQEEWRAYVQSITPHNQRRVRGRSRS